MSIRTEHQSGQNVYQDRMPIRTENANQDRTSITTECKSGQNVNQDRMPIRTEHQSGQNVYQDRMPIRTECQSGQKMPIRTELHSGRNTNQDGTPIRTDGQSGQNANQDRIPIRTDSPYKACWSNIPWRFFWFINILVFRLGVIWYVTIWQNVNSKYVKKNLALSGFCICVFAFLVRQELRLNHTCVRFQERAAGAGYVSPPSGESNRAWTAGQESRICWSCYQVSPELREGIPSRKLWGEESIPGTESGLSSQAT